MTDQTERGKAFLAMHDSGMTYQSIGDAHGISHERVRQLIRAYAGDGERMASAWRKQVQAKLSNFDLSDVSLSVASEKLGCSRNLVKSLVDSGELVVSKHKQRTKGKHYDRMMQMATMGMCQRDVAKELGIAQPNVSYLCKKYGIKLNDARRIIE